ncbi:LacI family DNA-binding transcriptional regulator [Curtobacterium sp. MCBD17_040]|uniref:LacI family DNA-binding transcriptional regulator n=1 Tax=Curtobacterium sp. MCBD17_040 TaxID=2175674 RepID=UPI0024DF503E|nr:LacI family DNA-binding transcriptional regulator [Curtobacterium sp. MCBD17_040]WIB65974.1 LacI family DNA-binding transcriptional regulator [Curtobacterium sp. MCBD17_040]
MEEVAALAGVSRGTVSRYLNGGRYVSPDASAAIRAVVERTGYVANLSARSLVTKRSDAFALVLPEPQDRLFEDPNFAVLIRESTERLAREDRTLVLMLADTAESTGRVLRWVQGGHVDGVFLVSAHRGHPLLEQLQKYDVPAVAVGRPLGAEQSIPYVAADDREGARMMTRHLIERGRRRVAIIAGPEDTSGGVDRLAGYSDVVRDDGLEPLVFPAATYSSSEGEVVMSELLQRHPDVDGVFAASDLLAAGALTALRRRDIRVPEQVALGGFDDSQIAALSQPPLTTVKQPMQLLGARMVELLLARSRGEAVRSEVLPTELVVRSTT